MKKVLIIKMSALGDVFMALPHIDAILSHHNQDEVRLLTSPPFGQLFANHPRLKLVSLDRSRWLGEENTYARIFWVRRQRYDSVYDLQGNRTSRLLVRFSNATRRVGTQPNRIYNYHPNEYYRQDTPVNVFDRLNETIVSAGLPAAKPRAELYPSREDKVRVARWKAENGIQDGRFCLLHAGSSRDWPSKRWPQEYFKALAVRIEAAGRRCVWIGGVDDSQTNRSLATEIGIDATEQFSILQLYQLGKSAAFAVANDSGPMHILSASGMPVYGFFGPTSWIRSHVAGQAERVFKSDIDCSPCFLGRCPPDKAHACLRQIEPEFVYRKIEMDMGL